MKWIKTDNVYVNFSNLTSIFLHKTDDNLFVVKAFVAGDECPYRLSTGFAEREQAEKLMEELIYNAVGK